MINKKKVMEFSTSQDLEMDVIPDLSTAKSYIPDWYKDIKPNNNKKIQFDQNNNLIQNVKNCVPFFDAITSGYMVELHCDVHFEIKPNDSEGRHYARWGVAKPEPLDIRNPELNKNFPIPVGCEPTHYVWNMRYNIKTPKGYSLLITHPMNRFDLPFLTLSGIVDSDDVMGVGWTPFFLKKDFEGVIEKGTPIMQIIPFKRDSWEVQKNAEVFYEARKHGLRANNSFFDYYKKNQWKKKYYE